MRRRMFLWGVVAILFIIPLLPSVNGLNTWGVADLDARTYNFTDIYSGSVIGTTEYPTVDWTVINNADINGNDRTDLYLRTRTISGTGQNEQFLQILDSDYMLYSILGYPTLFTFWDQDTVEGIQTFVGIAGVGYILPIEGNTTGLFIYHWGVNWTQAYAEINAEPNYNCTWVGNLLVINCTKFNQLDISNGLNYNLTKTIVWDYSTGWLISLDIIKTYEFNLFQSHSSFTSEPGTGDVTTMVISLNDVFWIIAIIVCSIAAALSIFIYYRVRRR